MQVEQFAGAVDDLRSTGRREELEVISSFNWKGVNQEHIWVMFWESYF